MAKIYNFENIEPKEILHWFKQICQIPHGSFKEKALSDYLANELRAKGCEVTTLATGALFIKAKATYGHDDWPTVLLQGHIDMVQVNDPDVKINFDTDPIKAYYDTEKGWLKADGTTLGADNGIAIAMFMELLTNPQIEHGPLEALFTTGEEVDTSVCMKTIPNNLMSAKYYINLDSDHDNTIYYGSAGVYKVSYSLPLKYSKANDNLETYEIDIQKLQGGHSALVIHIPAINAITFMCKTLLDFMHNHKPINLVSLKGGSAHNAIPTWTRAVIQINKDDVKELNKHFEEAFAIAKVAMQGNEDAGELKITKVENVNKALDINETNKVLKFYSFVPNGMLLMNQNGGCMFNSSNVGLIKTGPEYIDGVFLPRSFYKPDLLRLANLLAIYAKENGATNVKVAESCACWLTPDFEQSRIINLWKENYIKVVGSEPYIRPNPGGLEVAEIIPKNEKMLRNAMSTGPIIFKEHSTFENCPVESIKKIWKILQLTLKGLNK